jgi:hypothetical protein
MFTPRDKLSSEEFIHLGLECGLRVKLARGVNMSVSTPKQLFGRRDRIVLPFYGLVEIAWIYADAEAAVWLAGHDQWADPFRGLRNAFDDSSPGLLLGNFRLPCQGIQNMATLPRFESSHEIAMFFPFCRVFVLK